MCCFYHWPRPGWTMFARGCWCHSLSVLCFQARVFNETPINPRKCAHILTKILYLINQVRERKYTSIQTCASGPKLDVIIGISFLLSKQLGGAPWCHGSYRILLCYDQAVSVQWCKSAFCFLYLPVGTNCPFKYAFLYNRLFCPGWSYLIWVGRVGQKFRNGDQLPNPSQIL